MGAKVVLLPFATLWVACWLAGQAGRVVCRYPLTVAVCALVAWGWLAWGEWSTTVVGGVLLLGASAWWYWGPESFARWMVLPRTELRRFWVYATRWRSVMRLAELTRDKRGREYRPGLGGVRAQGWRDVVRVRMVRGQAPEQWEARASGLAHAFDARSCRVRVIKPGVIALDLIHADPLVLPLDAPPLADAVDLRRLVVGRTETGRAWRLRLHGNHVLVVGSTGAGKGSLLWSVVRALAPAVRAGSVRLYGVDPKGGMELGQAPGLFTQVAYDNGDAAVTLLEDLAAEIKRRATSYRGRRRSWSPESGDPFLVLVVDELADLIAYQADKALRERAARAVQTITSQGRAPGAAVLALVQDPRKEIVSFRHLFTIRIAMRLDEPTQVDMVLGDGVRQRGAAAHEISEHTPGVAWVKEDGKREPVRARAFHITDDDLAELAVPTLIGGVR
ncbi:FtsK/SpoIIIE domain-containing protein [Actinokineospora inagensis]|uniref:FtsK/SpoIIIE domain-containing protein n=1 Tax=Actinokineospora inagensis TaxID=103730 RepID=UPI000686DD17